jgi:hypothetical protein
MSKWFNNKTTEDQTDNKQNICKVCLSPAALYGMQIKTTMKHHFSASAL